MGSFGSPFGFIIMIRSKRKKFLISFVSLLSVFSFFSVSASDIASYKFSWSRPYVTSNSCYMEVVWGNGTPCVIYAGLTSYSLSSSAYYPISSAVWDAHTYTYSGDLYLRITPALDDGYPAGGFSCFGFYTNTLGGTYSLTPSSDGDYLTLYIGNVGGIASCNGYNVSTSKLSHNFDFYFSYGDDNTLNDKLDSIISGISGITGSDYNPAQPDPGVTSGIGDVESGEQAIVDGAQGNFDSAVSSGNSSILNFFNSAGNSLVFVKTLFNNLVADKIYILIIASVFLALLPVLINVAGGLRK